MAKRGRPTIENPKQHMITFRMSDEEYDKLVKYNQTHNQTITETMSEALRLYMENINRKA